MPLTEEQIEEIAQHCMRKFLEELSKQNNTAVDNTTIAKRAARLLLKECKDETDNTFILAEKLRKKYKGEE